MGLDMCLLRKIGAEDLKVMYWRKSNHIHGWFVKNVQGGEDDCMPHEVTREQLSELKAVCETVQKDPSKARQLLPRVRGFFFGSEEYGVWYFDDISQTIKQLSLILADPAQENEKFYYVSSW